MLVKAILTALLLSSSAMAQTYGYQPDDVFSGRFARRQFVLASDVTLSADRQSSFIRIDPRFWMSRIRLDLQNNGRTYVQSLFVRYFDGRTEVIPVNQMISPRMPRLVIDLPRRNISAVAINSSQMRAARGGGYRYMRPANVRVVGLRW